MEMLHGILILIFSISSVHCQECFVPGQCVDSDMIDHTFPENDIACLTDCHNVNDCQWFTYKPQFNLCELFANCLNRNTDNCSSCTSGETDCNPYQCQITGFCRGHLIRSTPTSSYNQCLMECVDTSTCGWFTFEKPTQLCYLFTDCVSLDETCQQCTSGEAGCPLLNEGYTKFIIATGSNGTTLSSVEVIDTSDSNLVCKDLPPYPTAIEGATGGLIGNTPLICGGAHDDTCYSFVNDSWQLVATMSADRYYSASAVVRNSLLVMGGATFPDTSDMVGLDSSQPGPKLPGGVYTHCAVALNESTIMIIGGLYQTLPRTTTYYYHLYIDQWVKGPDLNTGRYWHSCATITSNDHVTVVAAGGFKEASVEVLQTGGSSEWSYANPLPVLVGGGQLVPDATGNGVFMIGGYDDANGNLWNTIYHMACVDCKWVKMTQTLKNARVSHVAIHIPDNLVTCE